MIGQRVRRREDPRFITDHGQYGDDLVLLGVRHITFVRSDWAHAEIVAIDASEATALDEVEVFTAADAGPGRMGIPWPVSADERVTRPDLAEGTVRYVGEILAVVVSATREHGVDAAELVAVEFEPLPVITDPRAALRDEVLLYPDVGSNVILHQGPESPDPELFAGCEVTISGATTSQRVAVAPIEPRACAIRAEPDGTLTVWSSTHTPHADPDGLVAALGLEPDQIRLIAPDVGGSSPNTSGCPSSGSR